MEKERSILELLELTKSKMSVYFNTGLCDMLYSMQHYREITPQERNTLRYLVLNNKPRNTWFYRNFIKDAGFYWKEGNPKPRIKWINRMIDLYQLN